MKNLKICTLQSFTAEFLKAVKICSDDYGHYIYFASDTPGQLYCFDTSNLILREEQMNDKKDLKTSEECNIISVAYSCGKVCLVYSSGDVIAYFPTDISDEKFKLVGSFSSNICNSAWSPDGGILVVLTTDSKLTVLTDEFVPLLETDLQPEGLGENMPISVGWGSKTTQFHGSEGKMAAVKTQTEIKSILPWDDLKPRISWCGDGEHFATSVVDAKLNCRILRIWRRNGILQHTSTVQNNLEHSLCWRPSGNLITCSRQQPNKHEIVFFEKNCLPYGNFTLPFPPNTFLIKEVLWNFNSTILIVWGHEMSQDKIPLENKKFHVLLFTTSNYHWYLKQHLDFSSYGCLSVKDIIWDSHQPNKLHVLCDKNLYLQYTWEWTYHHSLGKDLSDDVVMTVIDGDNALMTPFRKQIIPPPMSSYSINMPVSVNCIAFAPSKMSKHSLFVLSDGRLILCHYKGSSDELKSSKHCSIHFGAGGDNGFIKNITPCCVTNIFRINKEIKTITEDDISFIDHPLCLYHWTWISPKKLLCVSSHSAHFKIDESVAPRTVTALFALEIPDNSSEEERVLDLSFIGTLDDFVLGMFSTDDGMKTAIQLHSGKIMKFENGKIFPWLYHTNKELQLPSPCIKFSLVTIDNEVVIFALSELFSLFCNDNTVITNCTSYCIRDEYLVVTTADHFVKCYSINTIINNYRSMTNHLGKKEMILSDVASQPVEPGTEIVVSIPFQTSLVLQVPRGNLETIHPRPFVLSEICRSLNKCQFWEAFKMAKKHRIDLNILYDHNPKLFLENIDIFIEQISSMDDLNLFVTNLRPKDMSRDMYGYYFTNNKSTDDENLNKMDLICDTIRSALEKLNDEKYNSTIVATYVQKSEPELEKALAMIKGLRDSSEKAAEETLKFLLYLKNVTELYNVALGMYDFDIAIMVAEKSNMDPKEYLPFLNNLQKLEENYRKYKINMHLKKFKEALLYISKCVDRFDECLDLIKNYRLYTNALFLFPLSSSCNEIIWNEYGSYLMTKMHYKEAGLIFTKVGNHEKALEAYYLSGDWKLVLCAAHSLHYSTEMITSLCQNMANKLKENQRFEESAHLLEFYVNDIEESIVTLIDGLLWDSSLNVMTKYNRLDIAETHLKPALKENYQNVCNFIDTSQKTFLQHLERLQIIRKEKDSESLEKDGYLEDPEDDLFSDTSSTVTGTSLSSKGSKQLSGSIVTKKSSRSRKKYELKKYRLKEGSPNENLALMTELSEIITKVDKSKDNFLNFLEALVKFDFIKEATILQQKMKGLEVVIQSNFAKIWLPEESAAALFSKMKFGPTSTATVAQYMQKQKEIERLFQEKSIPQPLWRRNMDIFLQCLI